MNGPFSHYFAEDHRRLDDILRASDIRPNEYDMKAYGHFRSALLKHIKLEETLLFPALEKSQRGVYTERIAKLRLDHGALTALMVPPPSPAIINAIRFILAGHNQLEEEPKGLYDLCDEFIQDPDGILSKMRQTADVPLLPHNTEAFILEATRRALARAGYNYDDFEPRG
ncbi:MAG: hemerythrin domain-containing protein [Ignavibacteriae bacterium]|nr:MAG: hemerythrin domain-containing protein [Ignavibacteriota bacterium]